jgi:hypothetical protein
MAPRRILVYAWGKLSWVTIVGAAFSVLVLEQPNNKKMNAANAIVLNIPAFNFMVSLL